MQHHSHFFARAVLALAGLLATLSPVAADEPLSLSAAVSAALARSRGLDASTAAAQGAREMAEAAAQRPDPILRLSLEDLLVEGPDRGGFSTTMRSIALMQTLPSAGKRRARAERFEREADGAMRERGYRAALLQTTVAQAWLERRMQEQRWVLLQAQITEARVLVQTTEAALRGGYGATSDALNAREAMVQLEQGLVGAQAGRAAARLTLARFTGGAPDQPLADPPPTRHTRATLSEADLLRDLPELVTLQAREAVARAQAEVARQELKPDWSTEIKVSQRGPAFSNMVSIGVSVPLLWDRPQRQQRELAARMSRVHELEAEREEQTRERMLQVQLLRQDWRAGLDRLALLDAQRQPLATQRVDAALAGYRGGREALGPLLLARREALALALERLALARETDGLWAQLEYLIPDRSTGDQP